MSTWLVLGIDRIDAPFKQVLFVPAPDIVVPLSANADGEGSFGFEWPPGLPSGVSLYSQVWAQDATGPAGLTASQGWQLTTP